MLLDFTLYQTIAIALLFIWAGFVRTGLGFGGAALGLAFFSFYQQSALVLAADYQCAFAVFLRPYSVHPAG